jgi:2-isopropylmalate synthase
MKPVRLYDTTLRDGTQGENISFTAEEKIKIAKRLDEFGIHYIEGGWPGSNPRDMQFFQLARKINFENARLTAFGSTRKPHCAPSEDSNVMALLDSDTPAVAIVGKSWDLHVLQVMNNTLEENLNMIRETVAYLKDHNLEVIYDAEHFFDGYLNNTNYALETIYAAADGGADYIVLCDTNGGTLPFDIESILNEVNRSFDKKYESLGNAEPVNFGIHAHNDCGVAVANSLVALQAKAVMVQGTINGYGERCGNADLTSIIPILGLKMQCPGISGLNLPKLKKLSRFIAETANMIPLSTRPFVGKSAFAHKGGIHVNAIMKTPRAYEHMTPELVGNRRRVLISDLSGRSNVEYRADELGVELGKNGVDSRKIVSRIKHLEQDGYQFDAADESFKILLEKLTDQYHPAFELESFRVIVEKDKNLPCSAQATVKISVDGRQELTAAEGNGPVSALDNALRKALNRFFPDLDSMQLVDFKVRVIDGREGTAARVRVLIESRDKGRVWSTMGVSDDIIEASWQALADSFHCKLSGEKEIPNHKSQITNISQWPKFQNPNDD